MQFGALAAASIDRCRGSGAGRRTIATAAHDAVQTTLLRAWVELRHCATRRASTRGCTGHSSGHATRRPGGSALVSSIRSTSTEPRELDAVGRLADRDQLERAFAACRSSSVPSSTSTTTRTLSLTEVAGCLASLWVPLGRDSTTRCGRCGPQSRLTIGPWHRKDGRHERRPSPDRPLSDVIAGPPRIAQMGCLRRLSRTSGSPTRGAIASGRSCRDRALDDRRRGGWRSVLPDGDRVGRGGGTGSAYPGCVPAIGQRVASIEHRHRRQASVRDGHGLIDPTGAGRDVHKRPVPPA